MPIDYSETIIYKIFCKDSKIQDMYIGHTINLRKRINNHKCACNNEAHLGYQYPLYTFIRMNGGWDNWQVIILKTLNCVDKNDAKQNEQEFIKLLNPTLNKNIPNRSSDQYRLDNLDRTRKYGKIYANNHKEERKEYNRNNPDIIKTAQQKYRETHREECRERCRLYKQNNLEKERARYRLYQQNKRNQEK